MLTEVRAEAGQGYRQTIDTGTHQFHADLPTEKGGAGIAPDPH